MRKTSLNVFGFSLSLICLWLALRNAPFSALVSTIATASSPWLLLAVLLMFTALITRAKIWVILLNNRTNLMDSFWAECIGYLFTNVLPLRMGDPARVVAMSKRRALPIVQVASSAVLERLLDTAIILMALAALFPFMNVPDPVKKAGSIFGMLVLMAMTALILLIKMDRTSERCLRAVCRWLPILPAEKILIALRQYIEGVTVLCRSKAAIGTFCWALGTWALFIAMYWSAIRAFQPNGTLVEASFMLVAICLALTMPSSPGFIGVFQWVGQQALVIPFGGKYDPSTALAITLTIHMMSYIFTTILGIIGLSRFGLSFRSLRIEAARAPSQ